MKEIPFSKVYVVVPNKKDKKGYLVFNSKEVIYILGLDGKEPKINQIKIPFIATSSMSINENNHRYEIVIPCLNQKIYNFTLNGKKTIGWNNIIAQAPINKPVDIYKVCKERVTGCYR